MLFFFGTNSNAFIISPCFHESNSATKIPHSESSVTSKTFSFTFFRESIKPLYKISLSRITWINEDLVIFPSNTKEPATKLFAKGKTVLTDAIPMNLSSY